MRIHIFDSTINNVEAWWKIVLPVEYCKKYYTLNIVINFFALCAFCAIWHFQTSYKCIEFRDLLAAYYYIYKKRKKIKEHKNVDFISSQIRQTGVFNNRTGKDIYRAIVILNKIFLRARVLLYFTTLGSKELSLGDYFEGNKGSFYFLIFIVRRYILSFTNLASSRKFLMQIQKLILGINIYLIYQKL